MRRTIFAFDRWAALDRIEGELALGSVRVGSLFAGIAAAIYALLYRLAGPVEFSAPHLVASACLLTISALSAVDPRRAMFAAVTVGMLLFGYQLMLLAQIDNGITVWFLVPNVAALLLGAHRLALYCALITVAELAGVVAGARLGWLEPQLRLPNPDVVMALSIVSVIVLAGAFALIAHTARLRLRREVEARNEQLAAALEEARVARNAALDAARVKERFFANLTHEIRTPLNGISGTAELLGHTALSAEQRPLAAALTVSAQGLAELVDAMLDHAKLAAGHVSVDPAPLELRAFADEVDALYRARALARSLELSFEIAGGSSQWIEVDGLKLRQIVNNLVSNAIKFTVRGSVRLNARVERRGGPDGDALVVSVSDTGIGIPADRVDAVFEPFVQADASITRAHGGTGLGLAIASQLARVLGGSLTLESRPGEGSTFTLTLPVRVLPPPPEAPRDPAAAAAAPTPTPTPTPTTATATATAAPLRADRESRPGEDSQDIPPGTRVLLVEDNEVNRTVARAMLVRLGVAVEIAVDGREAVARARDAGLDLILMDLQMPVMDGIDAAREIRREEQLRGASPVPILAMTGNSREDYGEACERAGMDGFVVKPVKIEQLRRVVAAHAAVR